MSNNSKNEYKVIVIGNSGVGKTSLMIKYQEGKIASSPTATVGVGVIIKNINIDGENISVCIWDTAGQERYVHSIGPVFYRNTDAIIVVYAVTSRKTFDSVKVWLNECTKHGLDDVRKVIIGNKTDCLNREVETYEGQNLASNLKIPFYETSQSESKIEEIFMEFLRELYNERSLSMEEENLRSFRVDQEQEKRATSASRINCCTGNSNNQCNFSLLPGNK